jgi:hypothetical protein
MNDRMMDIISLKNRLLPGPLDTQSRQLFSMACYDLDTFRKYVTDNHSMESLGLDAQFWQQILEDDEALLKFSMTWLHRTLLGSVKH